MTFLIRANWGRGWGSDGHTEVWSRVRGRGRVGERVLGYVPKSIGVCPKILNALRTTKNDNGKIVFTHRRIGLGVGMGRRGAGAPVVAQSTGLYPSIYTSPGCWPGGSPHSDTTLVYRLAHSRVLGKACWLPTLLTLVLIIPSLSQPAAFCTGISKHANTALQHGILLT